MRGKNGGEEETERRSGGSEMREEIEVAGREETCRTFQRNEGGEKNVGASCVAENWDPMSVTCRFLFRIRYTDRYKDMIIKWMIIWTAHYLSNGSDLHMYKLRNACKANNMKKFQKKYF